LNRNLILVTLVTLKLTSAIKQFKFDKLLESGDIESNPGPKYHIVSVKSYNVRGLKNKLKLKRVLNTCHKEISQNNGSIIFLQETHLEENDRVTLDMMWRHSYVSSPGTNRQCGCLILFDTAWEVIRKEIDIEGRLGIVILKRFDRYFTFTNVYAPNDHNLTYFSNVFNKIIELQTEFPESINVIAGDFNLVLEEEDSINRLTTNTESQTRSFIKRNLARLGLLDSYRIKHKKEGFTWARNNCMSRLDMIFASEELCSGLQSSEVKWSFDDSDHAMIESNFAVQANFDRGPGISRVNTEILDDKFSLEQIKEELELLLNQIPDYWNPHVKLDFVKSSIRSVISMVAGKKKRAQNFEHEAIVEQLNILMITKQKLESGELTNPDLLTEVNNTINTLEAERNKYLEQLSKKLSVRAQVKWYEEGERSNKYFLNIIKKRGEQKLITKLSTQSGTFETQDEIMNHVTQFYQELYDCKETNDNYDELLSDLPRLNEQDRNALARQITMDELKSVLDGCKDSAPGPDGISYKIYKTLWTQVGQFLLDSWKYSVSIGILSLDQRVSAITLLPKPGKSPDKIENWRPITLSNCDLKIFTKLYSDRVSKVLDKVIHPSQTAYVPGRCVHDNLRMFEFYNKYCRDNNVDALLISLDAKKAFDSVSHKYLHRVLQAYGFSDSFIQTVKMLYNDIKANVLVNGYKSVIIKILRSVKQGDALSCALFILCIDPLIRKIESNNNIKPAQIPRSRLTSIRIKDKVGGFADDIGLVVNNDPITVHNIFKDYSSFSSLSGIELNVEKTEILKLNVNTLHNDFVPIPIVVNNTNIYTVESLTICGICYSNNVNTSYDFNIIDKINKLEKQLIIWLQRPLSVEGKILITKTFGLSQLIYVLQMCEIEDSDLRNVERIIFKFLWNKKWIGNSAPDRIKRATLKLPYARGGLQAPDIAIVNKALKVKQFLRAMKSNHPISLIQKFQLERVGYDEYYKCEYAKINQHDNIVKTFQLTCNQLTDKFRNQCSSFPLQNPEDIANAISIVASTDVLEYLMRKNELLIINRFGPLARTGIITYRQLYNESNYPRNNSFGELAKYVLTFFPRAWASAITMDIDYDSSVTYEHEFPSHQLSLISHSLVSVKSIRNTFLEWEVTPTHPYLDNNKFQLLNVNSDINPFITLRKCLHMPRDRFYKYRILQGDIFCKERMFKFKMVESSNCDFCLEEVETIKHMLWDCPRAQQGWRYLKRLCGQAYNDEYVNYDSIVLGSANFIPLVETLIMLTLKCITAKDRSNSIDNDHLTNKFKSQYIIEKAAMKNKKIAFEKRWGPLEQFLFRVGS